MAENGLLSELRRQQKMYFQIRIFGLNALISELHRHRENFTRVNLIQNVGYLIKRM